MRITGSQSPALNNANDLASDFSLINHGLQNLGNVYWNLPSDALYEEALYRKEGFLSSGGPLAVTTGKWTARAANDKYIVKESTSDKNIWWGVYNRPIALEKYQGILQKVQAYLQLKDVFVQDCFVGADSDYKMPIRIIAEKAWQALFARNMFINIENKEEYKQHIPDFTLIAVPHFQCDPTADGTRSETAMIINFAQRIAIVAGSFYGGEIKKTMFTIMNYLLPLKNVMAMHCSANVGKEGDVALFFGLSGTGKTTLSADSSRQLIGDDEHGWCDNGVFNFEGGCYAKVIRLSAENEPEIYSCTQRYGTILENVIFDPITRKIDLNDDKLTENTRASYPLEFIPNSMPEKMSPTHPKNVIFLTCDAQGVLPPISRLDMNRTMYHFISGYTSKIAGTEMGLGKDPEITFSACFGAPFMVHHPFYYANLLKKMMELHGTKCWLVNTGWIGGKFGVGKRISIRHTRNMLNAVLEGHLDSVEFRKDKVFGFDVPITCPNVPEEVLDPANAWSDKQEYWQKYNALASRYIENFKLFEDGCDKAVIESGPTCLDKK